MPASSAEVKQLVSKIGTGPMKPRRKASSFPSRGGTRRNPFGCRNCRPTSLRRPHFLRPHTRRMQLGPERRNRRTEPQGRGRPACPVTPYVRFVSRATSLADRPPGRWAACVPRSYHGLSRPGVGNNLDSESALWLSWLLGSACEVGGNGVSCHSTADVPIIPTGMETRHPQAPNSDGPAWRGVWRMRMQPTFATSDPVPAAG